jgi:hypothetical protein
MRPIFRPSARMSEVSPSEVGFAFAPRTCGTASSFAAFFLLALISRGATFSNVGAVVGFDVAFSSTAGFAGSGFSSSGTTTRAISAFFSSFFSSGLGAGALLATGLSSRFSALSSSAGSCRATTGAGCLPWISMISR